MHIYVGKKYHATVGVADQRDNWRISRVLPPLREPRPYLGDGSETQLSGSALGLLVGTRPAGAHTRGTSALHIQEAQVHWQGQALVAELGLSAARSPRNVRGRAAAMQQNDARPAVAGLGVGCVSSSRPPGLGNPEEKGGDGASRGGDRVRAGRDRKELRNVDSFVLFLKIARGGPGPAGRKHPTPARVGCLAVAAPPDPPVRPGSLDGPALGAFEQLVQKHISEAGMNALAHLGWEFSSWFAGSCNLKSTMPSY